MNKNNNFKAIIILILVFLLIMLIVLIIPNDNEKTPVNEPSDIENRPNMAYLIVNNNLWGFSNNRWVTVKNKNINKKFNVYVNNNYLGMFNLEYINAYSIFDDADNVIDYNGELIAHTEELNLNIQNYQKIIIDSNDINTINNLIDSNININALSIKDKIIVDLNNDGKNDSIINVSNLDDVESEKYFNLIYANIDNEIFVLEKQIINAKDVLISPIYTVNNILNINNENYNNIILKEGFFSLNNETTYLMYNFQNNKYQKV